MIFLILTIIMILITETITEGAQKEPEDKKIMDYQNAVHNNTVYCCDGNYFTTINKSIG